MARQGPRVLPPVPRDDAPGADSIPLRGESSASCPLADSHALEKSPRLDQIGGVEALCKSLAHRYQKIVRLPSAVLQMPETRKARRRPQLPRERTLLTRRLQ